MAVDEFLSRETDTFVLPSRAYYPLKIPIAYDTSSPRPNPTSFTTPVAATCTASGHGYVCVGGADEGNFAAISVAGFPPADPAQVDSLLPLDLTGRTNLPRPPLLRSASQVELARIGSDIVNSISIHKLPTEATKEDEVVAVLTNNDKKVHIFSLERNEELSVLEFPFAMNHATISPDGQLLVAVGDQHTGFFFQRTKSKSSSDKQHMEDSSNRHASGWTLLREVSLYVPTGSCLQGYFTTAWSSSGSLCAVGSECGYITLFDVELLKRCEYGEDAVVELVNSTRPDANMAGPGAVRTMQFSPAPWDFLVWSEDQARVCVADLRSNLKTKQVLSLDAKAEDTVRVQIADFDLEINPDLHDLRLETNFIRRYRRALDSEGTAAAVNFANDYIATSSQRQRRNRTLGTVESDDDPYGLTAHERRVLEALRTTRPRVASQEQAAPRSINYNTTTARDLHDAFEQETPRERNAPRRQSSMVVSLNPSSAASSDTFHLNITGGATTRSPHPMPATPQPPATEPRRDNSDIVASTDDAWRTIEDALAQNSTLAQAAARTNDATRAALPELRDEMRRLRQLTQMRERLRTAREASRPVVQAYINPYRMASRMHYNPSEGLRTAGLAMSPDGRMLYCGTEDGIFEFRMNLHPRKSHPAIQPC